jgi:DHA1 family tetracycline resistance protein-like MFS transporter
MPQQLRPASLTPVILVLIACCESSAIAMTVPSLPALYARAADTDDIALVFGLTFTIFAIVNMLALPVLGTLSDRFGRRPLLLVSLAMLATECMVMAFVPILSVLIIWRVLSGLTHSTSATLAAWLADITPTESRTRRFGYLNASYGIGFFIGPLVGGVLSERWLAAPYILAGVVAAVGIIFTVVIRAPATILQSAPTARKRVIFNPLRHLLWLGAMGLAPIALVYFAVNFSFRSPDALWAIYTAQRFQFTPSIIGLTLTLFGLFYSITQIFLAGPIATKFGPSRTAMIGVGVDACSMLTLAFTSTAWVLFPLLAPLSFGSISNPALQSLMSMRVDSAQQGRLQGALGSLVALATAVAPLACNAVYAATSKALPGAAWLLPVALYAVTVFIWLISRRRLGNARRTATNAQA